MKIIAFHSSSLKSTLSFTTEWNLCTNKIAFSIENLSCEGEIFFPHKKAQFEGKKSLRTLFLLKQNYFKFLLYPIQKNHQGNNLATWFFPIRDNEKVQMCRSISLTFLHIFFINPFSVSYSKIFFFTQFSYKNISLLHFSLLIYKIS